MRSRLPCRTPNSSVCAQTVTKSTPDAVSVTVPTPHMGSTAMLTVAVAASLIAVPSLAVTLHG